MKQKILAFVTDGEKFLVLRNNSADKKHGGDFWFTVTGAVEEENLVEAVAREVMEETSLVVRETLNLNWGSIYSWAEETWEEFNFLAFVEKGDVKLNEEHVDFKWLDKEELIELIKWDDDKNVLRNVLDLASKKKLFFSKPFMVDYRKNEKN